MSYIIFQANPWWLIALLCAVLWLSIEVPFRWGSLFGRPISGRLDSFNAVQAGLLTLASFVLGLSFSQAEGRFDARRALVIKEANAIGTTWLRADQLARPQRRRFRRILIDYTSTRLQAYQLPRSAGQGDEVSYQAELDRSNRDQEQMWGIVSPALRSHPGSLGLSLLMQTLNDTIDVSAEQLQALTTHVPIAVVVLTLVLVTLGALSLGLRFAVDKSRPAALSAIYVVASVIVVTMMIDYDRPQTGFVRVDLSPIKVQLQSMGVSR
jgi:hypothetical protein